MKVEKKKRRKTGGRTAGTPNKVTASMKETVIETLKYLQTQDHVNMQAWAVQNPTEFYKIASKLIPSEIVGQNGSPLFSPVTKIEIVHTNASEPGTQ